MTVLDVLIGIAVLALVIWRQLSVRPVAADARALRVVGVLGVVGLVQVVSAAGEHPAPALAWGMLLLGLVVAAGLGVVRAATVRIWWSDGRLVRQGTALTALLWVVGIGVHVGLDLLTRAASPAAAPIDSASVLLFIAVSLAAQAVVQTGRTRALTTAGM